MQVNMGEVSSIQGSCYSSFKEKLVAFWLKIWNAVKSIFQCNCFKSQKSNLHGIKASKLDPSNKKSVTFSLSGDDTNNSQNPTPLSAISGLSNPPGVLKKNSSQWFLMKNNYKLRFSLPPGPQRV